MTDEERVELITQIASNFGISCDNASYIIKSFENFGKEYMMSNIEDDVKVVKRYLENSSYKESNSDFFKNGGWEMVDLEIPKAMANILSEREQDKARIKELEEKNRMLALEGSRVRLDLYIKGNYIPKQKVKDVLNDIYDYFERLNGPDEDIEYIESKRKELLEEGE